MTPLPASDMRSNLGTWAVPTHALPTVGHWMHDVLPNESYDPHFRGQRLDTTYFDTPDFALRKARLSKARYLTLRVRCYDNGITKTYALSVKTESEKWRSELTPGNAHGILYGTLPVAGALPPHLAARLQELCRLSGGHRPLCPVVTIFCRRFAVEDDTDRYTLDVHVQTDQDKSLPFAVLEYKTTNTGELVTRSPLGVNLRPIKLSKFLWSTKP